MEVICIEDAALYVLIEKVVDVEAIYIGHGRQ